MNQSIEPDLQIPPGFLNSLLQPILEKKRALVVGVHQEAITGAQRFNASLWRLHVTYDRPAPHLPSRLVAKLPTAAAELNERAAIFQPGFRENWFYRSGASRSPINVPHCYYNGVDASTNQSILLLEDLAPTLSGNQLEGAALDQARLALESLAGLHAAWWEDTASPEIQELTNLLSATWDAEQNLVQELYDSAWPRFVEQGRGLIPDEVLRFGTAIVGNMKAVDALADEAPKTLAHGDFRLDNLLFGCQEGKRPAGSSIGRTFSLAAA